MIIGTDIEMVIHLFCDEKETSFDIYVMLDRTHTFSLELINKVKEEFSIAIEKYYALLKPVDGTNEYADMRNDRHYTETEFKEKLKNILMHMLEQRKLKGIIIL